MLETALNNPNAVIHPIVTILNAGRIEYTKGNFLIYHEGVTASVARVLEAVDRERLSVLKALSLDQVTFFERLFGRGNVPSGTILEQFAHFSPVQAPSNLDRDRFIIEDIPYGLVPIASLGEMLDVSTPVIKSLITLASTINQVNYMDEGRTVEKMGISKLRIDELNKFLIEGTLWHKWRSTQGQAQP